MFYYILFKKYQIIIYINFIIYFIPVFVNSTILLDHLIIFVRKLHGHTFCVFNASSGLLVDVNLSPRIVISERCRISHSVNEAKRGRNNDVASFFMGMITPREDETVVLILPVCFSVKPSTEGPAACTKPATKVRSPQTRHDALKITSMEEYKKTMKAKANNIGI